MEGSIRRRSKNSWELTVDQGRGADGKRRRKFLSFKGSKSHAQQKLRELLMDQHRGVPIATEKITVRQWLTKWMAEYVKPNARQRTVERYQGIIDRHIVPFIGHVVLSKLTPSEIQAMEAGLTTRGMAPKGVELVHTVISGAYKYALRMEVVWRNPAKAVTPPKVTRREVEPPDIARVKHLLALAEQEEEEARQGRELELKPLVAAFGRERAELHLEKEYALPEVHGSVRLGADGAYETVFPVGQQLTVTRPPWFILLNVGLPKRRARVRAIGKLLSGLAERGDLDLEKTARKLAAQA